ncbi:hypothetical protein [Nostoc sp. 'Lobaria pulmonaria (5183) cyanobiont']|uniref:hypothetical protein n=1 Tax=Nostoc sp. 'Lobaria pulmonaria (5183) cyanobiont' TaxID=1618022 RepID=UPI00131A4816|nr:hypothetical protein [Nostoc sp. 'Lobaria pulmonaria (5183) cyanobiont']
MAPPAAGIAPQALPILLKSPLHVNFEAMLCLLRPAVGVLPFLRFKRGKLSY